MKTCAAFFVILFSGLLYGKPLVDFCDSYVWGFYVDSCDRPHFGAMFKEKKSHVIVLTDANVYEVEEKRRQGYEKLFAYLFKPRICCIKIYQYIEKSINQFVLFLLLMSIYCRNIQINVSLFMQSF